jgi:metallo-beta-lactamase family protein
VRWIAARQPIAGSLFLDHGEPEATLALEHQAAAGAGPLPSIIQPMIGERYLLPPGAPARRLETGRTALYPAAGHDWQNDYAAFASRLKQELARIEDAEARSEAIARMADILHAYQAATRQRAV